MKPGAHDLPVEPEAARFDPATGGSTSKKSAAKKAGSIGTMVVTLRVNDLNAAIRKVNADQHLGPETSTLDAYLQVDIAPLESLGQQIAADTTVQSAQAAASTVFTDYRLLAIVLPASRIAGDTARLDNGALPTLRVDAAKVTAKVTPTNETELGPLINNLNAEIASATSATSGLAATVLGYTPSKWNANQSLLSTARGRSPVRPPMSPWPNVTCSKSERISRAVVPEPRPLQPLRLRKPARPCSC
jgi:hypothetical protein